MTMKQVLDTILDKHNQNHEHPFSGNIYYKDQHMSVVKSYGFANRAEQLLNTIDTRFGIASGCKLFTAIAICQLVEAGRLSLEDAVVDYIKPYFPLLDSSVKVYHLLTHTSGIADYCDEEEGEDFEALWTSLPMYTVKSSVDFLPLFINKPAKFSAGERFHYNNAGFILLGLLVEQVSGQSFRDYVEVNIFKPSGMLSSGYFSLDQLPSQTAIGFIDDVDGWRTNIYALPIIGGADGGAFTTVEDMTKFWEALISNELLSQSMTNTLLTPHIQLDEEHSYGYGIWIKHYNNNIFKYYVMGSDPGVIMESSYYPQLNVQVHALGNIDSGAGEIAYEIDSYLREKVREE